MIGRKVQITVVELGNKLREMSEIKNAKRTTIIHLFGVLYADEMRIAGISPAAVIKAAGIQPSYVVEINKGINLAKYLELKPEYKDQF